MPLFNKDPASADVRPGRSGQAPPPTAFPPAAAPPVPAAPSGVRPGRLGTVLVSKGALTQEQLDVSLTRAAEKGVRLGEYLLEAGMVSREQLGVAIAEHLGVPYYEVSQGLDPTVAELLDAKSARRYEAVPVGRDASARLLVAMSDPSNVFAIDDLRLLTRHEIKPLFAHPDDIHALLGKQGAIGDVVADLVGQTEGAGAPLQGDMHADISDTPDDAPVVRLVNSLIARAVEERASDIHFEPQAAEMAVRYRVDGVLRSVASVPSRLASGVTSRVKVMAELDIAEKRQPQDGRVGLSVGDRGLDLRVATLPTVYGEKVVMRVLDKSNVLMRLSDLGFARDTLVGFERCYKRPYGAVLVTGPTGSGKSTTLYGALNILNTTDKNIITVEDPVEYRLGGINQVQVNPKAGLTFAAGLRSILRCDPDIVMIGEIRDRETAQIAVESALTGHLVLATLHTNDSAGALTRLSEMGVEPYLFASAVVGVLAQRLARRLCDSCKKAVPVSHSVLKEMCNTPALPAGLPDPITIFEAQGCDRCGGLGYRGRLGVYELLTMSEQIQRLAVDGTNSEEIMRVARADGMRTLLEDGLLKVLGGATSLEELARAVG